MLDIERPYDIFTNTEQNKKDIDWLDRLRATTDTQLAALDTRIDTLESYVAKGVLQVVTTTSAANTSITAAYDVTATPTITSGTEVLSRSITPTTSASIIHIVGSVLAGSTDSTYFGGGLFNTTSSTLLLNDIGRINTGGSFLWIRLYFDKWITLASASAITYSIRVGTTTGQTFHLNSRDNSGNALFDGSATSFLTITEYGRS